MEPIHPGEILFEDFIIELNMTIDEFANLSNIDKVTLENIINGKQSISKEIAEILAKFFNISVEFWLNLQNDYDKEISKRKENKNEFIY